MEPLRALSEWTRTISKISPDDFQCKYFCSCNKSIDGELVPGHGCCMSYVGPRYGKGFKLVVVGMDHGEFEDECEVGIDSYTVEERSDGIIQYYGHGFKNKPFNQHYHGVIKLAALILGEAGRACAQACKTQCAGLDQCLLTRIAQPNLVKCVPKTQHGRTSKSKHQMRENCAHHLLEELKILEPQLVIFQGVDSQIIPKTCRAMGIGLAALPECANNHGPVLYEAAAPRSHFLFVYHPSRGWMDRQWPQIQQWSDFMCKKGIIPR